MPSYSVSCQVAACHVGVCCSSSKKPYRMPAFSSGDMSAQRLYAIPAYYVTCHVAVCHVVVCHVVAAQRSPILYRQKMSAPPTLRIILRHVKSMVAHRSQTSFSLSKGLSRYPVTSYISHLFLRFRLLLLLFLIKSKVIIAWHCPCRYSCRSYHFHSYRTVSHLRQLIFPSGRVLREKRMKEFLYSSAIVPGTRLDITQLCAVKRRQIGRVNRILPH